LLHPVALAQGHGLVLQRLRVDGDSEGRAGFILAAVAPADGTAFVVEYHGSTAPPAGYFRWHERFRAALGGRT